MPGSKSRRLVVLGTGTGVGKTHVARAVARALGQSGPVLALKPVETGAPHSDARELDALNPFPVKPHPLYALDPPISPHLAARQASQIVEIASIIQWISAQESLLGDAPESWTVIETAGGVLSPLSPAARNFELALALEPAEWLLVAPDALGVLNQLSLAMTALAKLGRKPDAVVLSSPPPGDASTGTNAAELSALGIVDPVACLKAGDQDVAELIRWLRRRGS
jgi:dethiobiotin synthetase